MRSHAAIVVIVLACAVATAGGFLWYRAATAPITAKAEPLAKIPPPLPSPDDIRGVYMTANTAQGKGLAAKTKRDTILRLLDETELNALVIDVKESGGAQVTEELKQFVASLADKPIWKIARVVVFADNSQTKTHPDWYLHYVGGGMWRDRGGVAWLDPAKPETQNYIVDFADSIVDLGFNEIQFDYIRYPSDGSVGGIKRTVANKTKREIIADVFKTFSEELRARHPDIKLSIDVFGYVTERPELSIGQALADAVPHMDYISPMVYPSHYYSGYFAKADKARGLPAVNLSRQGAHTNPETVVYRS